jgi:hypothetical protein
MPKSHPGRNAGERENGRFRQVFSPNRRGPAFGRNL